MSQAKRRRSSKRQRGQFLTPRPLARRLVDGLTLKVDDRILEPGFGDGSFLIPLIQRFLAFYEGSIQDRLRMVLSRNIWGVEIDPILYEKTLTHIEETVGPLPEHHNLLLGDYLEVESRTDAARLPLESNPRTLFLRDEFTHIIGNPPFGGTIAAHLQDPLEKVLGFRNGMKIKKETYSWFIIKSMDLLSPGGQLRFICSDTFLTISTMKGLRNALAVEGSPKVQRLNEFSDETSYPMVVLDWYKNGPSKAIHIDDQAIDIDDVYRTPNLSWGITPDLLPYFSDKRLGDVLVATSGMTTGNNRLFIREAVDSYITEPYRFSFEQVPITLEDELRKSRLGRLSDRKRNEIAALEALNATQREVIATKRSAPIDIKMPHPDYLPYNKATRGLVYRPPTHYIYWKDDGDAVLTYKKTGNWYLRGVGGAKFFGMEGLTWRLVSAYLDVRFLPSGYILDSGAPCAFPLPGVAKDEMIFIMGWMLTTDCNRILKQAINHTMNIQGKDVERLPYPIWVDDGRRYEAISLLSSMLDEAMGGRIVTRDDAEFDVIGSLYRLE